jgi:alpha-tubulin suppressor-like RCC1 family protein
MKGTCRLIAKAKLTATLVEPMLLGCSMIACSDAADTAPMNDPGDAASGGAAGSSGSDAAPGGTAGQGGQNAELRPNAIAALGASACALDEDGSIHCWGHAGSPWDLPQGTFVALFSSTNLMCAVRDDRAVACFGAPIDTVDLSYVPAGRVRELAVSSGAICGISEDGEAFCDWSDDRFALPVPTGERFKSISTGSRFACGLRESDGSILCWGSEGDPTCGYSPQAGQLNAPAGSFAKISSGRFSSCAIRGDGSAACWGAGEATDDPNQIYCDGPINFGQSVPPAGSFDSIAIGDAHTCGIQSDGTIACWGVGTADECSGANCRQSRPPPGVFEQVAASVFHNCAMRADRTIECWGWDGGGDGRTTPPAEFQ